MKRISVIPALLLLTTSVMAQIPKSAEDNAALRYWNAFAQMSDMTITDAQTKQLEAMANGSAAWDESTFGKLLDDNRGAMKTMMRGTALPYCVWGIDYGLAEDAPIPQVGRGRALARLNVLTAARLSEQRKSHEATDHLISGVRFARDLGAGMPLIGVLVGKSALTSDFNMAMSLKRSGRLSPDDFTRFTAAVRALSPDVFDWSYAIRLEAAAAHSALVRLHSADDPIKMLEGWGIQKVATKDARPSEADIRKFDEIMSEAERLFRQPASSNVAAIADLDRKIGKLAPVPRSVIPSLQRANDRRKEVEELRQKVLSGI